MQLLTFVTDIYDGCKHKDVVRALIQCPFCHAERGFMYYYALIHESNICTAVYAMPAPLTGDSYVTITEEQYTSQSVLGMRYENGVWVEVTTYYYAILNDKNIVTNVYESETEMATADNLVEITAEQYADESLIGKYYNRDNDAFIEAPISVLKEHSTDEIQYKGEEKWLSTKLDEMEQAIANAGGTGSTIDAYTKTESDERYALAGTSYTKEESDAKYALAGATGATMTASEILTAIQTVDGSGSGLDADTLDGKEASEFALTVDLEEKANATHTHAQAEVTGLSEALAGKADSSHTHDGYAPSTHSHAQSEITGLSTALAGKADSSHTHTQSEISGLASALAGKSDTGHTHIGYASSSHTHSGYASSSHTHSYLPLSGGTVTGEVNFSGGLVRTKGTQTLYNSGTMINFGSGNLPTNICGESIYSTKSITVSSDQRLKADIHELDRQALIDFAKQVQIVSYRYLGEEDREVPHVGVIAQQLLEINPEIAKYFVQKNEEGYYTVDYTALSLLALLTI